MLSQSLADAVTTWRGIVERTSDAEMERTWRWRGVEADVRWAYFRTYEELLALADAIATARLAAGKPITLTQRALARYHGAFRELQALLARASEDDFDRAPAEREWPLRQVLGHVMRGDLGFLTVTNWALERRQAGDDRPLAAPNELRGHMPEAEPDGAMAEVLARFTALHERVLGSLVTTPDDELGAPIGFWYTADVGFQLHRFDAHLREHTIQAEKVLEAILPPPSDGWRMFRLFHRALGEAEGVALGGENVAEPLAEQTAAAVGARATELRELMAGA